MNLNIDNWKEFRIGDLFDIHPTKALEDVSAYDCVGYGVPLVVNQSYNNGVAGLCDFPASEKGGIITFSDTWEGETFFYQPNDFIGFAHVQGMYPKKPMSRECLLFITTALEFEARGRYSYGRKKRRDIMIDVRIKLPTDKEGNPDWLFMESFIKALHYKPLKTKNKKHDIPELKINKWKRFYLGRLFNIYKGCRLTAEDQEEGNNNYIGAIDSNNGVANHIGQHPIHEGNTISLSYNGSVGEAFYQPEPYWATDDVNALYPKYERFNVFIGLFIVAVIRQEKYRFSYGRKWTLENMKTSELCLPIQFNSDGTPLIDKSFKYSDLGYIPDWHFMENYIKSLPYGDRLNS